jgi:hypothetical protein
MKFKNMIVVGLGLLLGMALSACGPELNPKTQGHIKSALEAKKDLFKACYESALKRDRTIEGDMALLLDINAKPGTVTDAKVEKTTIKDEEMGGCVANVAKGITLPEPPEVPVEGHYGLEFGFEK